MLHIVPRTEKPMCFTMSSFSNGAGYPNNQISHENMYVFKSCHSTLDQSSNHIQYSVFRDWFSIWEIAIQWDSGAPCSSLLYVHHQHTMQDICVIFLILTFLVKVERMWEIIPYRHIHTYSTHTYIYKVRHKCTYCFIACLVFWTLKVQIDPCNITSNGGKLKFVFFSENLSFYRWVFSHA